MDKLCENHEQNVKLIKDMLPSKDILTFSFSDRSGQQYTLVYADGLVQKQWLGELVVDPLSKNDKPLRQKDFSNFLLFPELKEETDPRALCTAILDGNPILLSSLNVAFIVGVKAPPARTITEPPTSVTVKGPREGFVEDVKLNVALLRKRIKSRNLMVETVQKGRQSKTHIAVCYLEGIAKEETVQNIRKKIDGISIDLFPDSSYVADLLSPRKHSIFAQVGTTEKPDVFAAKIAEGRVGILVDGSPIGLTLPFLLVENFQAPDDYFTSPFFASITRTLRFLSVIVAILLPALYVSSQLFKLQLLPLNLTLTIASSIQGIPLSPSLEMFLVLFVLEVIKEASIRMPKYVGMALSVVGALVLGETAVSAGFVSTPAIIIVAFSGLCLYTVPDFVETGTILRWLFLIVSGSFGPFGIVTLLAFFLYYLASCDSFGAPILYPFSPLQKADMKDSLMKYNLESLQNRPALLRGKNKKRMNMGGQP